MRIVTLGHSLVGKTTYMAALYGALQSSVGGFTLRTSDSGDHERLCQLSLAVRRGEYPPATAHRSRYSFALQFRGSEVLSFEWADYRGGDLTEFGEREHAKALQADLAEADGLMMMLDGAALMQQQVRRSSVGRMMAMVASSLGGVQRPLSLAIVLTKFDMVNNVGPALIEPFQSLIAAIEVSANLRGALIPVACGRRAINTPMPLLFALHAGVSNSASRLHNELSSHRRDASWYQENSTGLIGLANNIYSWWNGTPTNAVKAALHRQLAAETARRHEQMLVALRAFEQPLAQLAQIQQGRSRDEYLRRLGQSIAS